LKQIGSRAGGRRREMRGSAGTHRSAVYLSDSIHMLVSSARFRLTPPSSAAKVEAGFLFFNFVQ
jgi:hypothetical protein